MLDKLLLFCNISFAIFLSFPQKAKPAPHTQEVAFLFFLAHRYLLYILAKLPNIVPLNFIQEPTKILSFFKVFTITSIQLFLAKESPSIHSIMSPATLLRPSIRAFMIPEGPLKGTILIGKSFAISKVLSVQL